LFLKKFVKIRIFDELEANGRITNYSL